MGIDSRVVVITGASFGIGKGISLHIALIGYRKKYIFFSILDTYTCTNWRAFFGQKGRRTKILPSIHFDTQGWGIARRIDFKASLDHQHFFLGKAGHAGILSLYPTHNWEAHPLLWRRGKREREREGEDEHENGHPLPFFGHRTHEFFNPRLPLSQKKKD